MADPIEERLRKERQGERTRAAERLGILAPPILATGKAISDVMERGGEMATEATRGFGAAPVWQDVGGVAQKVKTGLGLGGAGIWDTAADVVEYLTGMKPRRLMPETVADATRAWGIKAPAETATVAPAAPGGPAVAETAVPGPPPQFVTEKAAPRQAAPHPLAKYATIYDALRDMKEEQFKRFVDTHDGIAGPLVPGIGYVTTKGEGGKERIVRVIQNPADQPQEPMTIPQAEVAAKMMAGIGAREEARARIEETKLAREEKGELKERELGIRETTAKESRELRRDQGIDRTIAAVGTVTDPDTGEKVVNPGLAIHRLNLIGFKREEFPRHYQPVWDKVTSAYEKFMADWERDKNKGKKATEEQRKAGAKAFEKYLR